MSVRGMCQWFVLCTNPATATQTHPTLGEVPICKQCKDRFDQLKAIRPTED
jgi:hypothetical protein